MTTMPKMTDQLKKAEMMREVLRPRVVNTPIGFDVLTRVLLPDEPPPVLTGQGDNEKHWPGAGQGEPTVETVAPTRWELWSDVLWYAGCTLFSLACIGALAAALADMAKAVKP
jgi:hypothetical protein